MHVEIVGEGIWVIRDCCDSTVGMVAAAETASSEEWGGTTFLEMSNACSSIRSWVAYCPRADAESVRAEMVSVWEDYSNYYENNGWKTESNAELFKVTGIGTTDYLHVPNHVAYVHCLLAVGPPNTHRIRVERFGCDMDLNPGDLTLLPPMFPYDVALCGPGDDPSYFLRQFLMQS